MLRKNIFFASNIFISIIKRCKVSFHLKKKFLITIFLLVIHFTLFPQSQYFSFEHFTIAEGLSNNSINAILQTRDGFIWIATKDGLNRFDGQNFMVFKHDPNSANTIPENYMMSLFESGDGTFWIGTWGGGLCKYDPIHESFIKIETNLPNDNYVQCIDEDKSGTLWFGTLTGGLFKYNPHTKQTLNFNINANSLPRLLNNNVTTLIINPDNSLWIGTWGSGFSFFDENKNIVRNNTHSVNKNSLSNNNIWYLQKDEQNKILISTDYDVDLYDPNTNSFEHILNIENKYSRFLNSPIRQTFRDSYNRLWIGTYE